MSMKVKKNVVDMIGVNNAHGSINEIINDWIEQGMATSIVNEKDKSITRDQN